jgi:hypothetical protein
MGNGNLKESPIGRETAISPVRVFGTDHHGKSFSATAHIIEVGGNGVRLGGVSVDLAQGDIVDVQRGNQRGRFRVTGIGKSETAHGGAVELEGLGVPQASWGTSLSGPAKLDKRNRRQHLRHTIAGVAVVRTAGLAASQQAALADLSFGGCYLQTLVPLSVDTSVTIQIKIDEQTFGARGVVRTCHPNMGMGIQFTGESNRGLQAFLKQLEKGEKPNSTQPVVQKANAVYTAGRMHAATNDLREVAQLIQCTPVDPQALREFRDTLDYVRNTALALERYLELQAGNTTPAAQLGFLVAERIRVATQLCKALIEDVTEVSVNPRQLNDLLAAVGDIIGAESKARRGRSDP